MAKEKQVEEETPLEYGAAVEVVSTVTGSRHGVAFAPCPDGVMMKPVSFSGEPVLIPSLEVAGDYLP